MLTPAEPQCEFFSSQPHNTFIVDKPFEVSQWAFQQWGCKPFHLDMCIGILNTSGIIVGAFGFNHWNGNDCELHFYGPSVLKKDIVKTMFLIALDVLKVNRVTVRTRKEHMRRGVQKLGAEFECIQKCIYGAEDIPNNHAHQYVFHYRAMQILAGRRIQ